MGTKHEKNRMHVALSQAEKHYGEAYSALIDAKVAAQMAGLVKEAKRIDKIAKEYEKAGSKFRQFLYWL